MRILQVVPRLSSKYGGGGFTIAKNLTLALAKRGHYVGIFTSDYDLDEDAVQTFLANSHIWTFPFKTIFNMSTLHITSNPRNLMNNIFDNTIKGGGVDVVHMQGCRTWQNVIVYQWAKKYKIPYVVDAHGFPVEGTPLRKLFIRIFDALFANRIVRNARFCIAETETGAKEYLRAGVDKDKIAVIPCPYDLSVFDSLPSRGRFKKRSGLLQQQRIVLYLGGLDYIKGLDFLVKAFAKMHDDKAVLVLVGEDMGFRKTLEKLVDDLSINDKVLFTGGLYGQEKLEALVDADVAVFPSRAEQGLPFAALEAIMCDTPVIVTDGTGAAEDVKKMGAGLVVGLTALNEADLIQDLNIGIQHILDYKETHLIKNGQSYIRKNLSITEKVKDYEKLYGRCLK